MKYCANCGMKASDDSNYCQRCGSHFESYGTGVEPDHYVNDKPETDNIVLTAFHKIFGANIAKALFIVAIIIAAINLPILPYIIAPIFTAIGMWYLYECAKKKSGKATMLSGFNMLRNASISSLAVNSVFFPLSLWLFVETIWDISLTLLLILIVSNIVYSAFELIFVNSLIKSVEQKVNAVRFGKTVKISSLLRTILFPLFAIIPIVVYLITARTFDSNDNVIYNGLGIIVGLTIVLFIYAVPNTVYSAIKTKLLYRITENDFSGDTL